MTFDRQSAAHLTDLRIEVSFETVLMSFGYLASNAVCKVQQNADGVGFELLNLAKPSFARGLFYQ